MKARKSSAVWIFLGALLVAVAVVGLVSTRNPDAFRSRYRMDYALDQFILFCVNWWIPAGIIGVPMFLISLILSLIREKDSP